MSNPVSRNPFFPARLATFTKNPGTSLSRFEFSSITQWIGTASKETGSRSRARCLLCYWLQEQWGKLTDDDLNQIAGRREQLEGKLQQRYGYQKDQIKKEVDAWYGKQSWPD
ncbi:MAG: hypothetical protein NTAFB05_02470 [Nitrobacter sp.]